MQSKPTKNRSSIWLYILLWLFFVYLYTQILSFDQASVSNVVLGGMYFIQFGVHEASHIVFGFLPAIMVAAAGSLGEIAFTSLIAFAAFRAKSYFAGVFSLLWVMLAMTSAGNYMADARAQAMPLVGPSENPQHDWHFVFGQLGWLNADTAIGGSVRFAGDVIGLAGLILGLVLIIGMVTANRTTPGNIR